ncbi:MAG: hypothetical protein O2890_15000 [Cyanobacteria bacterium]|nr:hypothetical protein [Cyanobacteriota bacterium]
MGPNLKLDMQDQQKASKVTLYLSSDLHRQLKIRSAVDGDAMSAIAQRALEFYLSHGDVVDECSAVSGHTHQIYSCPSCDESMVMRQGELLPVQTTLASSLSDDFVGVQSERVTATLSPEANEAANELVPC